MVGCRAPGPDIFSFENQIDPFFAAKNPSDVDGFPALREMKIHITCRALSLLELYTANPGPASGSGMPELVLKGSAGTIVFRWLQQGF